jgi:uncharacterized membrane protein
MVGFPFLIAVTALVVAVIAMQRAAKLSAAVTRLTQELERLKPAASPAAPAAPPPPTSAAWEKAAGRETPSAPQPEPSAPPPRDVEQALAGRWFVWIGGIAIAIGGLLFVKYAYDNGLISPSMQVLLGLAAGLVLIAGGVLVRRKSPPIPAGESDYVPAALSAAGLAVLFAAIYAAYALYAIAAPATAFAGLAAVGLFALLLSRTQGPFIAALGLLGSYVTPALIPSAEPSAWMFFPYLLVILVACFLTLRGRAWWWLGHGAVLGAFLWSMLWMMGPFQPEDIRPIGLSAIVLGLVAMFTLRGMDILRQEGDGLSPARGIGLVGQAAAAMILLLLAARSDHAGEALVLLSAGLAVPVLIAWAGERLSYLAPAAGVVMLLVLGGWREAAFHALTLDEQGLWTWSSAFGPEAQRFLRWMLGAGAAFTLIGAAGVLLRRGGMFWGALGGGAGFFYLWGAWARADFLLANERWALLASGCGLFLLLATALWSRRATGDDRGAGLLTLGAAAVFVMALDRLYDGLWLTLAIAGLAFALALLAPLLKTRLLGFTAAAVASLATLRLFLSRELWFDDRSLPWGEHWVLYGYGIPVILFFIAAKRLGRQGHARSAAVLEGLSLGLLISLAALEIRVLIAGGITYEQPQFLEMAAHGMTWAGAAYGLMHRQRLYAAVVSLWGARLLLLLAVAGAVLVNLGALNPVVTGDPVPGGLAFNALLLAYLAPAALFALIARRLDVIGWEALRAPVNGLAMVLLFAYVTLQTKRVFQGMMMTPWAQSLAENYAYSVVWLGLALALFVAGIGLGSRAVRLVGLGVLALVVLKVFIGDLSNLEGLYRIASFVGLGLCLVGIGWLYQRFVGRRPGAVPA